MTNPHNLKDVRMMITGGRDFEDREKAYRRLDRVRKSLDEDGLIVTGLVHGGARGADRIGRDWAVQRGLQEYCFKPDWEKYGKRAGFIRNEQMLESTPAPVVVVAMEGGNGTRHAIREALKRAITVVGGTWLKEQYPNNPMVFDISQKDFKPTIWRHDMEMVQPDFFTERTL